MDALVFGFDFSPKDVMEMTVDEMAHFLKRGNAFRKRQKEAAGK